MRTYNTIILLISFIVITSCSSHKSVITIPANQSVEVDYNTFTLYDATIKNKSLHTIEIAVTTKSNPSDTIRGFGLGTKGKATVMVEDVNKLTIYNPNKKTIRIGLTITEKEIKTEPSNNVYKSFTLRNSSLKSIPLIIPTVMNPNLSPKSNSGVDLKRGQEVLFRSGGKTYVLFTVDDSIKNGSVIDVPLLLAERKKELGLR